MGKIAEYILGGALIGGALAIGGFTLFRNAPSLEQKVSESPDWKVKYGPEYSIDFSESKNQPLPYSVKLENKKTTDMVTELVNLVQRDYRHEMRRHGRDKLTPYEILQIFQKIDDEDTLPDNVADIKESEARRGLNMYEQDGVSAFPIDFEDIRVEDLSFNEGQHEKLKDDYINLMRAAMKQQKERNEIFRQTAEQDYKNKLANDHEYQKAQAEWKR